ncbi:flagellar hook-length control protein FliK [Saccharibacillus brassicae]|nr:flagellar hook-length control protein FliK [Saccharibacillus brassicae]
MSISGMTTGAPAAPAAAAAGSKAGTVTVASGAAALFGQSLQQLMGAAVSATGSTTTAIAAETPANPILSALQQLITATEQTSGENQQSNDGAAEELEQKLDELMQQLDVLDEQLTENPELMPMLQGWIQQAQALLGSVEEAGGTEQEQPAGNAVQALASNPATLKFALQDTVAQLIDLQQSDQAAPAVKVQAQQALAALEQTIQTVDSDTQTKAKQGLTQQPAAVVQLADDAQPTKNDQTVSKPAAEAQATNTAESKIVSAKSQSQQAGTQQEGQSSEEASQEIKPQGTITAGELAMRTNGTTPAKPVEAVPVHRMAQEVEKLVVDRLEILQKQGFTEAKISLTPDHLGKVDIRITMHAGQLVAHFVTEHAAAKDMLEQQMVQLRGSLQGQGLTVERLEVTQSSSLQSQMDQNGGQASSRQQQEKRSRAREEANDDAILAAELGEELGEWLRQKTAAQSGSSFIAEA